MIPRLVLDTNVVVSALLTGNTGHFPKQHETTTVIAARQLLEPLVANPQRE
jgi:predicted nucleic acid-binding protein